MKIHQIGSQKLSSEFPYLILEAGVNHEGHLERAFEMVDAASALGVPMIKFQSYKAASLASKKSPAYWDRKEETTESQFALFQKYDRLGVEDYIELAKHCERRGIEFCTTAFDSHFVEGLAPHLKFFKIASADLTNLPLLRQIGAMRKPVLLSTGASELEEIHRAVAILEDAGTQEIGLLHCVLEYPTQPKHANLLSIKVLQREFPQYTIGWSDHVKVAYGGASVIAAWGMGATIIEKHFTLDKSLPGNDHYHAMDVADVRSLLNQLRYMSQLWGEEEKRCLPCEEEARLQARRSLVASREIPAGAVITADMLIPKRPGTGISPERLDDIVGRTTTRFVPVDEPLTWEHIANKADKAMVQREGCLVS